MLELQPFPPTLHLEGSKLPPGAPPLSGQVRLADLSEGTLVFEEKADGREIGISFVEAERVVQSRGHVVDLSLPEYRLLDLWTNYLLDCLYDRLGERLTMFGEWMLAKHTVFYDKLPHFFLEFDVLDRCDGRWLTTNERRALFSGAPIVSVPVLHRGRLDRQTLEGLVRPSLFKTSSWQANLRQAAVRTSSTIDQVLAQTDPSDAAEGLYVKHETDRVIGRYKFIRGDFLDTIRQSGSHWSSRPTIFNQLSGGVDMFAPELTETMISHDLTNGGL